MGDMKMTIDDGSYYLVEQKPRLAIAKSAFRSFLNRIESDNTPPCQKQGGVL